MEDLAYALLNLGAKLANFFDSISERFKGRCANGKGK